MLTQYDHCGKFEGGLALTPLAYERSLDGWGEEYDFGSECCVDHYTVIMGGFTPTYEEIAEYDLTKEDVEFASSLVGFIVHCDDLGFVTVGWYEPGTEVQMAREVARLDQELAECECEE